MIIGGNLNIHVDATVARITAGYVDFVYARIPPGKEVPLWELLGGYADRLESFENRDITTKCESARKQAR